MDMIMADECMTKMNGKNLFRIYLLLYPSLAQLESLNGMVALN